MASISGGVWAIDIGNNSLKALHLSDASGTVEVIGFDNIQHGKILNGSGVKEAERDELIALTLRQFVSNNDLGKEDIIVSVPSQNSFARFVKLPPVEQKRIPEIVSFEAAQQIPFDINDVQWDWQLMEQSEDGENKVGIFAIKNDIVTEALEHYSRENIQVNQVQMASMALYNYVLYDRPELAKSENRATVILNIGAENTDLVIWTKSTVWQRCIPMGGNAFTKAISDAFKLNFEKAEKLKRTAPMSKYARQILQAMKPVFTDLASEIQRSLGFYTSSNQNIKLTKVIALGGGTKMRGLLKYLQQSLQIPIERPDSFKKLPIGSDVSTAKFHENVCDFGIVYGLGLQTLGHGRVESNLLPRSIARSMAWAGKAKYFIAAACILLLVSGLCLARVLMDKTSYNNQAGTRREYQGIIDSAQTAIDNVKKQQNRASAFEAAIQKELTLFNYRDVIPLLHETIISALPNATNNPEQAQLYQAFAKAEVEKVLEISRKERKQIFVTGMSVAFSEDLDTATFPETFFAAKRTRSKRKKRGLGDAPFAPEEDISAMMEAMGLTPAQSKFKKKRFGVTGNVEEETDEQAGAGFVVTITGYSPYKNIGDLMDPVGVENNKSKWGLVTWLMHTDEIADANSPFKLHKKAELQHFRLMTGEVDLEEEMPVGIGIEGIMSNGSKIRAVESTESGRSALSVRPALAEDEEQVLIDPMTKEVISKVTKLDEDGKKMYDNRGQVEYENNDYWFVLNVKFIWKDAPKTP